MTHHSPDPQFYEKIKIELPAHIHDGHHLRFIIFHVAVEPKKDKKGEEGKAKSKIEVGTAWFRFINNVGRIYLGQVDLSVYVTGENSKQTTLPVN